MSRFIKVTWLDIVVCVLGSFTLGYLISALR